MRLRLILLILSLLAFLSASVEGFLYYSPVKEAVFQEAERQAQTRLAMLRKNLSSFLAENIKPVKAMAGMRGLQAALTRKDADSLALGRTIREIAEAYGISIKTVNTYRDRLLKKLNLRNNTELPRFAIPNRLVEP